MKKKISAIVSALLAVVCLVLFGFPAEETAQPAEPTVSQVQAVQQEQIQPEAPQEEYSQPEDPQPEDIQPEETLLDEAGSYTTREDVALYIHTYGRLPDNFITKDEAASLGWEGGGLEKIAPGKCIGGDRFGNYEGLLPKAQGRSYKECDIDTLGAEKRGAKRIVFSNDGLIYYTDDHYESFTLLYGEP